MIQQVDYAGFKRALYRRVLATFVKVLPETAHLVLGSFERLTLNLKIFIASNFITHREVEVRTGDLVHGFQGTRGFALARVGFVFALGQHLFVEVILALAAVQVVLGDRLPKTIKYSQGQQQTYSVVFAKHVAQVLNAIHVSILHQVRGVDEQRFLGLWHLLQSLHTVRNLFLKCRVERVTVVLTLRCNPPELEPSKRAATTRTRLGSKQAVQRPNKVGNSLRALDEMIATGFEGSISLRGI